MLFRSVYDHQIFSSQSVGGVSRYFVELANGLSANTDIQPHILAPLHCNKYVTEVNGFSGLYIPAFPKNYRLLQPIDYLISKAYMNVVKPDLVHETYYQFHSASPKSCPTVVTAYDLIHERFHENFRIRDTTTLRKRASLRRAQHVIAISESTRQIGRAHV